MQKNSWKSKILIILYFHIPAYLQEGNEYMQKTKKWMDELEKLNYRVIDIETPQNQDRMYEGLVENWGIDDIVICGQDNIGSVEMLQQYQDCKYEFCSNPCYMYKSSLGYDGKKINMIEFDDHIPPNQRLLEVDENPEFINGICGTGLCCIKKELQLKMDVVNNRFHHQNFDYMLSKLARPIIKKFHLHYPLHEHEKKF